MKVSTVQGNIVESDADAIVVNLFEGTTGPDGATAAADQALGGTIRDLIKNGDLRGRMGEVGVVYPNGAIAARRLLIAGLGNQAAFDLEAARRASAFALQKARELGARKVASIVHGAGVGGLDVADAAQATGEGAILGLYKSPKSYPEPWDVIEELTLVESAKEKLPAIEVGARVAQANGRAVYLVRDLVLYGPNIVTPAYLAEKAREISHQYNMNVIVGDRAWAAERHMGAFLAVAKGAEEPPAFIVMEHNSGRTDMDTLALVGKGITFDTGGISLKPAEKLEDMKTDMAGAAAVLGAMQVAGELNLPLHLIAILPCTENMPDGRAFRPADILTASNGKTIEVISTDAEGRLVLADALVYASQFKPQAVIDLATLTGACVVALGTGVAAGIFCNEPTLQEKLVESGQRMHEQLWPLPLWDDYKRKIKSLVADIANSGGRYGGVGTSAIFLKEFIDYPWAHLDIAGMVQAEPAQENPCVPMGATGFGVRLLVDFLRRWNR